MILSDLLRAVLCTAFAAHCNVKSLLLTKCFQRFFLLRALRHLSSRQSGAEHRTQKIAQCAFVVMLISLVLVSTSCARPKEARFSRQAIRPKALPTIILDPGHGGANDGTKMVIAPYTKEKTLALETGLKVRDMLEQWGYKVRMTRSRDVFIPLAERVTFAKHHHGYIFVSIHYNHAPNQNAHGIEIFYQEKNKFMARSKKLATTVLDSIIKRTHAASRGCHPGDYHVLRENKTMPAILIEGGFFSNAAEAKKLSNPQYIRTLSYSIAQGIDDFAQHELLPH